MWHKMEEQALKEFIELLEQEYIEQEKAMWFDTDKKYNTLHEMEEALTHLKNIAYCLYDLEIE